MNTQYVVVMVSKTSKFKHFGIFDSAEEAEIWTEHAEKLIKDKKWLIVPIYGKTQLNCIDMIIN